MGFTSDVLSVSIRCRWLLARLFHREGAIVIISDILENRGRLVADDLGEGVYFCPLNVKNEVEWKILSEKITLDVGALDVLVNNAGITGFMETTGPHDVEEVDFAS
jgi:3(or 17)beta-hydroxysteroid dehydrogenase